MIHVRLEVQGMQRLPHSVDNYAKFGQRGACGARDLLRYQGKCLLQVQGSAPGGAQPPHSLTALFIHLPHQLKGARQDWLGRRIRRQTVRSDVDLHRGAEKALQQSVVKLLCDTGSLRQPLFSPNIEPFG